MAKKRRSGNDNGKDHQHEITVGNCWGRRSGINVELGQNEADVRGLRHRGRNAGAPLTACPDADRRGATAWETVQAVPNDPSPSLIAHHHNF